MEQRTLWKALKPWSKESCGRLKNHGQRIAWTVQNPEQRILWTAQNNGENNFMDLSAQQGKIILWTAPPWSEEYYGILRTTL